MTITLEEHFLTPDFQKAIAPYIPFDPHMKAIHAKLLDIGGGRIADMDAGAVDLQVLSIAAMGMDKLDSATATALMHDANDQLASAVAANPTRFQGFANVDLTNPAEAAKELDRCIANLGFKGAMLNGLTGGAFLDDPRFTPLFEAAQALDLPLYLHPAPPPQAVYDSYFQGLPGQTGRMLSMAGWGWHVETGLHALRLIVSGLFDRFPAQQIVIGHLGEDLPYSLARAASVLGPAAKHLQRSIPEYFHKNFHVTTSGYFTQPPFLCALQVVGADRLLYSVDYPFSANTTGNDFLNALPVSPADRAKISHQNARSLLKLP
jgi:predicted TIM-barrel fold metal-dependent hydrolase